MPTAAPGSVGSSPVAAPTDRTTAPRSPCAAASRTGPSGPASRGSDHLRLGVPEPGVALEERPARGRSGSGRRRGSRGTASRGARARRGSGGGPSRRCRPPRRARGPRAGCTRPSRRCSGPVSPSQSRLWSRAAGRATAAWPSVSAITVASRPNSRSSRTTRAAPAGSAAPRLAGSRYPPSSRIGRGQVVAHGHALARGEPVGLDDEPVSVGGQLLGERGRRGQVAGRERSTAGHRARRPRTRSRDRTPCSSRSGRRQPSARRPGSPPRARASATPAASGASGPTTTSSAAFGAGRRHDCGGIERIDPGAAGRPAARPRSRRCPARPRPG